MVRRNSGFTLVVALLLLVAMSLLGVAALRNVSIQEKMAGNVYFKALTLQQSESTLRVALQALEERNRTTALLEGVTGDPIVSTQITDGWSANFWRTASAWTVNQTVTPVGTNTTGITSRFISEYVPKQQIIAAQSGTYGSPFGGNDLPKYILTRQTSEAVDSATGARSVVQQYFGFPGE
jgi:Tfp pilus assembly protein PilX